MDHIREHLVHSLGHAYHIDRELGGGGMSRVFLSTEIALDRQVVLKVLPHELAGGVSVDRFKREISVAARLQHAHIVPLLSAGEANGLPWFSMPYVEGQSLRARLGRGELPIADAVRVLRDVASALAYAHGKGVVHRDIKPENILLAEGSATVTDFGVAKALADAGTDPGSLTSVGVALGTPAYMAPEQAAGDPRTDHRADLYAWGVVAYEVLAGHNPFAGRSAQATLAAHMTETPAPVEQARPMVPAALAQLVARCLAKSAADRPQSAHEIVTALEALSTPGGTAPLTAASRVAFPDRPGRRRAVLIAAGTLLFGVGGTLAWRASRAPELDPRTVAVLPFDVLGGDSAASVAARVAADWLSQGIVQTDEANVVASTAVNFAIGDARAGSADLISLVASATRAGTVVTGSVSRFGDSLRLQVSVVDARTRQVIRAIDPVTGPASDPIIAINALRDRVLGSIVSGDVARRVMTAGQPPSYAAYREYMAGAEIFPRSQAAARPYFRRAIALDSTFAAPYGHLAATFTNAGMRDSAAEVVTRLDAMRDRLSPVDRLVLDYSRAMLRNDAATELRVVQELARRTSNPMDHYLIGLNANRLLRPRLAIPALLTSDSLAAATGWAPNMTQLAEAYHLTGEHRRELEHLRLGRRRYPNNRLFVTRGLRAYAGLRDSGAAHALLDTILRTDTAPSSGALLGTVHTAAMDFHAHGDTATSRRLTRVALDWTMRNASRAPALAWRRNVARAYLDLGQLDSAEAHYRLAFPDTSVGGIASAAYLAIIRARRGDTAGARRTADSIGNIQRRWNIGTTWYWKAAIVAELGEKDLALQLLRTAHQNGASMTGWHYTLALRPLFGFGPFQALITPPD